MAARAVTLLRGEAREPIELSLGKLAVIGHDDEMILHQGDDLHREPKPLAHIGVARTGVAPAGDVIGLEPHEDVLHQVALEQLLGARAARDRSLELVVNHVFHPRLVPAKPAKAGEGRTCRPCDASPAGLTRGSILFAKDFLRRRWIAGSSPAMTLFGWAIAPPRSRRVCLWRRARCD